MKNIKELLIAAETIGTPIYEQNKILNNEEEIITQERIKVSLPTIIEEIDVYQISNFCKSFDFKCQILWLKTGPELQLYQKEDK